MGVVEEAREAMEKREFVPFFQPQYDALTGRPWSAEILARWIDETGKLILPGYFIPEMEMTDDILDLDWYMVREACEFLNRLDEENVPKIPISINFSGRHIYEGDTVSRLRELVDSYNIPHKLIIIEVAESSLMENPEEIQYMLGDIRKEDFRVALDDVGQGFTTLGFLSDLTIDVIKIDRSLFDEKHNNAVDRIVLESIFNIANRMNLNTVAEGIETEEQLNFLRTSGCKVVQGYLYDEPMPADIFIARYKEIQTEMEPEDILVTQAPASAAALLVDAFFVKYPTVTYMNLSRNSYYVTRHDELESNTFPVTSSLEERITNSLSAIHPDDREKYLETFSVKKQIEAYERGEKSIDVMIRQLGEDGKYQKVNITNIFVKSPFVNDILAVSLCDVLGKWEPGEV
ncbi:MAG: EAL domain-containing protein [Eubacterium sp.]|nr:EAL domain-containing protein [Eubacterium sp.]